MTVPLAALLGGIEPGQPGCLLATTRHGRIEDLVVAGSARVDEHLSIQADTVFDIASCSKQFTAACLLSLHRERALDMDADAREWLPELRATGLTLRSFLQHTSGLPDYFAVLDLAGLELDGIATMEGFIASFPPRLPPAYQAGTDARYSNTGYVLAAWAAARATGLRFADVLRRQIFDPLGMSASRLHDRIGLVVDRQAFGYLRDARDFLRCEIPEELVGDGAILTGADDLARWQGFLCHGDALGTALRDELLRPARLVSGRTSNYGHGTWVGRVDGHRTLCHGGVMGGFRSWLITRPDSGEGVVVLANRDDLKVEQLAWQAAGASVAAAPSPPPVRGPWFSRDHHECLFADDDSVTIRGAGYQTTPTGTGWVLGSGVPATASGSLTLRSDDTIGLIDWLGAAIDFERLSPEVPPSLAGALPAQWSLTPWPGAPRSWQVSLDAVEGRLSTGTAVHRLSWQGCTGDVAVWATRSDITVVLDLGSGRITVNLGGLVTVPPGHRPGPLPAR